MNPTANDPLGFNRRDFIKSGSVATIMSMMGGVELLAPAEDAPKTEPVNKIKVGVIGLGAWGRELVKILGTLPIASVAGICDSYAPIMKRTAATAPGATTYADYKTLLENKDIGAVIVATPTHKHKDIVLAALKAGKHVYCEAPIALTIEEAREIALAAKAAPLEVVFQVGLQMRCDPERQFLLPFVRSGNLGKVLMARAQSHRKTSWRTASANPDQEKALNWRLDKETSLGLIGEIGIHQMDQTGWFLNSHPVAITGFGSLLYWNQDNRDAPDSRDVADTIQAIIEFPGGVRLSYDATIANSFDGDYEVYSGSYAAVLLRESKAWMFKEVDSPNFGWEIYAPREKFYKETYGITLVAGASKSANAPIKAAGQEEPEYVPATVAGALTVFLKNISDVESRLATAREAYKDDPDGIKEMLADAVARKRPAPGFEGFQATVLAVKANEAVVSGKRVELKPEIFELA